MIKVHTKVGIKRWLKGEEQLYLKESTEDMTILSARSAKSNATRQFNKALKQFKSDPEAVVFAKLEIENMSPPFGRFFGSISGRAGIVIMKTGVFENK